jgi:hypothetical protein
MEVATRFRAAVRGISTDSTRQAASLALKWTEERVPGGDRAVPALKKAIRRVESMSHEAIALSDRRRRQPVAEWTVGRLEQAVVPEVAVDLESVKIFRAERFPEAGPRPWLDRPGARRVIKSRERTGHLTSFEAALCLKWVRDGYVVVDTLLDDMTLDYVWSAYEGAIANGVVTPPPEVQFPGDTIPGRLLDPHLSVPEIDELMHHPGLVRVVDLLLGARSFPFQSISGHKASQQAIHGDSIHMTTYPPGYLVAMWVAFEDIDAGSGPLEYYPGSHRLRTVYSADVGIVDEAFKRSGYQDFDSKYTPAIKNIISARALKPRHFYARKGDVLFWHANLLHGGSQRKDFEKTRKALVFHFFAEGCICYHDLASAASRVHTAQAAVPLPTA